MTARRQAELAQAYDEARPRLVRVAYAVLGSNTDAEDVVSDGWPRLIAADDREPILDLGAWATLTVRPVGVGPAAVGEGAARAVCRALAAGTDRPGDRRPRGSGDARRAGQLRAAGGARDAQPRRTDGLGAPRSVRGGVHRGCRHRRADPRPGPAARRPRPAPCRRRRAAAHRHRH